MPLGFSIKLSSKKKRKNKANAPVSTVSQPIQSAAHQPAPSSTAADPLSLLWTRAVEEYQRNTGITLSDHFANLIPQDYVRHVEDNFVDFRKDHERLWGILQFFADIAFTTAGVVGHALKLKVLPPAEAICGAVVVLLQGAKQVSKIYDEIADLLEDLHYLLERAYSYTRGTLEAGMERMVLDNLVCTLEILGVANKLVTEGRVKTFLRTLVHKDKRITESLGKLERLSTRENHTVNATMLSTIGDVLGVVKDSMKVGREHFDFVKLALTKVDIAADGVGAFSKELQETRNELKCMIVPIEEQARKQKLERLKPSLSLKSAHHACLEGTRKSIIQKLEEWSVDSSAPNVFWIYGHPGTGKSTIATTFSQFLAEEKLLGASCFFRRQDAHSHSLQVVWRALAHDLAGKKSFLGDGILQQLDKIDLDDVSPRKIFQALIADPLQSELTGSKEPLVVVIDALDEYRWSTEHQQRELGQRELLNEMLTCWKFFPSHVKLFVTSREQSHIAEYFNTDLASRITLEVGATAPPSSEAAKDIKTYFEHHFFSLSLSRHVKITDTDIDALTAAAAGLFIWASTVIAVACDPGCFNPILDQVREERFRGDGLDALGLLYKNILEAECWRYPELFVLVASTIIVARRPLSCTTLSSLLSRSENEIAHLANRLRPILDLEPSLQFIHKSFVDFITSDSDSDVDPTCPPQFICDTIAAEQRMTECCFRTMDRGLHFNMVNLPTSHTFNYEFHYMAQNLPNEIIYACHFWYFHLNSHNSIVDFAVEALLLLKRYLLFWFEVLSITGTLALAAPALELLIHLADASLEYEEITMLSQDALSFVRTFASAINASSPQIYLSALPLSPTASKIRVQYLSFLKESCTISSGAGQHWSRSQAVLQGHEQLVESVAFSHDGLWIVSGSSDHTIRVWDAGTNTQLGEPLQGHKRAVTAVSFSPEGRQIVSSSDDNTIRVWDADTHAQLGEPLQGHEKSVTSVAFSHDGQQIVSSSHDKTIRVWDAETHAQIGEPLEGHENSVSSVAFSPDGRQIVSGSDDHTLRIWDAQSHAQLGEPLQGHKNPIFSVAFSHNGQLIVSGSHDCTIRVWDPKTHAQLGEPLQGHEDSVSSVAFSHDDRQIVSGSLDRTIRIWDAETHAQLGEPLQGHEDTVFSVAFSPDGRRVVSGSYDRTIRVWDAQTHMQFSEPLQGHKSSVTTVSFSSDGRQILSGSQDHTIRIWDVQSHTQLGEPLQGHKDIVYSVSFSHDGRKIFSSSYDQTIRVWDAETHVQIGEPLEDHENIISSVAFSNDGQRIVSGLSGHTVRVWDAKTHVQLGEPLYGHESLVTAVSFSPDERQIVSGSYDCTIRVWDAETHAQLGVPLQGHESAVTAVSFSPEGRQIVSSSNDWTIRVWDAETHAQIGEPLEGHEGIISSVAFSRDGQQIVSGSWDRTIRIWDAETHAQLGEPLQGHEDPVLSVAFSPDGQRIVSGSHDRTIRVWDAQTHTQFSEPLQGHENSVLSVAFSPDGQQILSGSQDHTLRIWDVQSHTQLGEPLQGHQDTVYSVSFSHDGRKIFSSSYDQTIRVWDAETHVQIGEPLEGHENIISSVDFSNDGQRIVSGLSGHTVRVWDAETHVQLGEPLQGHNNLVDSVAFSPDGRRIISGSLDRTIRVWDAETHAQLGEPLRGHEGSVISVAFSSDGQRIVSSSYDQTIRVWDAETHAQIGEPIEGHKNTISSVAFSHDRRQIVSGSWDRTIRVWDAETHAQLGEPLQGHEDSVLSVAFSPDGRWIVSGSHDCTIRVWDAEEHAQLAGPCQELENMVSSVAFSSDGQESISGSDSNTINIRSSETDSMPQSEQTQDLHASSFYYRAVLKSNSTDPHLLPERVYIQDDGWVVSPSGDPLIWIPAYLRTFVQTEHCVGIIGRQPMVTFDFSHFKHGESWVECWKEDASS